MNVFGRLEDCHWRLVVDSCDLMMRQVAELIRSCPSRTGRAECLRRAQQDSRFSGSSPDVPEALLPVTVNLPCLHLNILLHRQQPHRQSSPPHRRIELERARLRDSPSLLNERVPLLRMMITYPKLWLHHLDSVGRGWNYDEDGRSYFSRISVIHLEEVESNISIMTARNPSPFQVR